MSILEIKKERDIKNAIRLRKERLEESKKIDFDRCMGIEAYDDDNNKLYIPIPPDYARKVKKNLLEVCEKLLKIEEDKLKQFYEVENKSKN